MYIKIKFRT